MKSAHKRRLTVVALLVAVLGLTIPAASGTSLSAVAADPVSAVGHVCDQFGLHNDWGTHQHGDSWSDHPYHGTHGPHGTYGPHGTHEPHGTYGPHGTHGPHTNPAGTNPPGR